MILVAIIGAADCDPKTSALAGEVGSRLARAGVAVVCGGLSGVMEAACRGAKEAGGLTIGILPGTDRSEANRWVDVAIVTGLREARNVIVARTAQAVIAIGGEHGTLSEIAFALKFGVPVIGLNTWQLARGGKKETAIQEAKTAEEAVQLVLSLLKSS